MLSTLEKEDLVKRSRFSYPALGRKYLLAQRERIAGDPPVQLTIGSVAMMLVLACG